MNLFFSALISSLLMFSSSALFAAKVQVLGLGETTHEPDVIQFSLNIQAKCYPTLAKASEAADTLANDLFKQLGTLFSTQNHYNQIITHGGYTQPYYGSRHRNRENLCHNTYQKNTQIKVITTKVAQFENLFNQVQTLVYNKYPQLQDNVMSQASAYVTISQPFTQISLEKRKQLEMQALEDALVNAKAKAQKLTENEGHNGLRLIELYETPSMMQPQPQYSAMHQESFKAADASAPISFEQSVVRKQISVVFEY